MLRVLLCVLFSCVSAARAESFYQPVTPAVERSWSDGLLSAGLRLTESSPGYDFPDALLLGSSVWLLGYVTGWDNKIRNDLRADLTGQDRDWFHGITLLGDGAAQSGLIAVSWIAGGERMRGTAVQASQALVLSGLTTVGMKVLFGASRPDSGSDRRFFDYSQGSWNNRSFPSGHTMSAFAMAEIYGAEYGRWWTYTLAAAVGWSRVMLERHWLSDVTCGALIGAALGCVVQQDWNQLGPATRVLPQPGPDGSLRIALQVDY